MSISTEISRLSTAKISIKTALENKGVTVPSGTKLDGMAPLIDSLSTGAIINDISDTNSEQVLLSGDYDGTPISTTETTIDLREYIKNNQLPLTITFAISSIPTEAIEALWEE